MILKITLEQALEKASPALKAKIDVPHTESWSEISGYGGKYLVSNMGNICSTEYHNTKGVKRFRILKQAIDKKGYMRCALSKNNILTTFKVHRLVAQAFVPNPNNLPQVNHINGNKQDNRAENLEWCDNATNQTHAYRLGLNRPHRGHCHPIIVIDLLHNNQMKFECKLDFARHIGANDNIVGNALRRHPNAKYVIIHKRYKVLRSCN